LKDKDYIQELFSEKLSQHESSVRPDLWQNIQANLASQTAVTSSVAAKSVSSASKWIYIAASVVSVTVASVYYFNSDSKESTVVSESKVKINNENTIIKVENAQNESVEKSTVNTSKKENTTVNTHNTVVLVNQTTLRPDEEKIITTEIKNASNNSGGNLNTSATNQNTQGANNPSNSQHKTSISGSNIPTENLIDDDKEKTVVFTDPVQQEKPVVGKISKLPNVISPNGDNVNDYLFLQTERIIEFTITIMDTRNNLVYSSNDPAFTWYGTNMTGEKLPAGKYYYFVTAIDEHNHKINKYNTLEIRY
jgi:gliding motility-associated-like protein